MQQTEYAIELLSPVPSLFRSSYSEHRLTLVSHRTVLAERPSSAVYEGTTGGQAASQVLHQKAQDAPEASGQVPVARGGGGQATEGAEPLQPGSLCIRLTRAGGSSAGPFGTKDLGGSFAPKCPPSGRYRALPRDEWRTSMGFGARWL